MNITKVIGIFRERRPQRDIKSSVMRCFYQSALAEREPGTRWNRKTRPTVEVLTPLAYLNGRIPLEPVYLKIAPPTFWFGPSDLMNRPRSGSINCDLNFILTLKVFIKTSTINNDSPINNKKLKFCLQIFFHQCEKSIIQKCDSSNFIIIKKPLIYKKIYLQHPIIKIKKKCETWEEKIFPSACPSELRKIEGTPLPSFPHVSRD